MVDGSTKRQRSLWTRPRDVPSKVLVIVNTPRVSLDTSIDAWRPVTDSPGGDRCANVTSAVTVAMAIGSGSTHLPPDTLVRIDDPKFSLLEDAFCNACNWSKLIWMFNPLSAYRLWSGSNFRGFLKQRDKSQDRIGVERNVPCSIVSRGW